jgi:hypothetical protein
MPVYAVRQALEELSSNSTWIATAMTQALVASHLNRDVLGYPSVGGSRTLRSIFRHSSTGSGG